MSGTSIIGTVSEFFAGIILAVILLIGYVAPHDLHSYSKYSAVNTFLALFFSGLFSFICAVVFGLLLVGTLGLFVEISNVGRWAIKLITNKKARLS